MKEKEHQSVEWKQAWRDEYLKWICGYANAYGGTIYIGTDDDGNVIGIDNAKELLDELQLEYNKLRQQSITSELLDIIGGKVD